MKFFKLFINILLIQLIAAAECNAINWPWVKNKTKLNEEPIFQTMDGIVTDSFMENVEVRIGQLGSVSSWPHSDYYNELEDFNHSFGGKYDIKETTLRPIGILSKKKHSSFFVDSIYRSFVSNGKKLRLAQPVVCGDLLIISNDIGHTSAINLKNNTPIWEFSLRKHITKELKKTTNLFASCSYDVLFLTTNRGRIFALSLEDGSLVWQKNLQTTVRAPFKSDGDELYGTSVWNKTFSLDAKTGETLWELEGTELNKITANHPSPLITGESIIEGHTTGDAISLDKNNGQIRWIYDIATGSSTTYFAISDIDSTPIASNGLALIAGVNGGMFAVYESNGAIAWNKNISSIAAIAVSGDFAFLIDNQNRLLCIRVSDGGVRWAKKIEGNYTIDTPKYLNNGKPKITKNIINNGPYIIDGRIVIISDYGLLHAFDPSNGELIESMFIPPKMSKIAIVNNTIYGISYTNNSLVTIK